MNTDTDNEVARLRELLEKAEEQISMLTEVLEDTEQVRDSWCEAYTEARDDLEATLNENQKLRELLEMALYYHENDDIRSQIRKQFDQLNK
jgi:chromosome segregation ATPase